MSSSLSRASEASSARSFDAADVAGGEVAGRFRRELFAVDGVGARRAWLASARTPRLVPAAVGDDRDAAGLERSELSDDAVTSAVLPRAAGSEAELVPFDPERIRELEGLGRGGQCV